VTASGTRRGAWAPRPGGAQGLGAGRSKPKAQRQLGPLWNTPPEAVFKSRQRVSRDGQHEDQTGM
ncbi:MAG: hypothetical protein ACK5RU_00950, partial [Hyphomonadaceae bacterium]